MYLLKKSIQIIKEEGFKVFILYVITSRYLFFIFKKSVIKKIKDFNSTNPEKVFDFSYKFFLGAIRSIQIKEEFLELLEIFKEVKPKVIMEIGTANGGTLFCFSKLAPNDTMLISVDLPGGRFGGGCPRWKIPLYKSFIGKNQKIHLIRDDSHKQETLEEVKRILNGRKVDFLFIDGDHTYEGVKKDFEMYSPFVKKEGIIAFHDIAIHPPETGCFVHNFWVELIGNYKNYKEIIKNKNQGWAGIGVLFK